MSGGIGVVRRMERWRPEPSAEPSSDAGPANHRWWEDRVSVMAAQAAPPRARWAVQSVMVIAALPTATSCARLHARNIACEWGLRQLANTVELVVSELVTNAVQASVDQTADLAIHPNTA